MLAVIILTHNEELHISRAIDSVISLAPEIFVVDSFSTDRTVALAKSKGAWVAQNNFLNYATQFQWALDNAPITAEWILRLDADEIVEPDLAAEIAANLPNVDSSVAGINLNRKYIFMDRWIRHGGRHPLRLIRLWRRGQGRIENRWMDEHIIVWGGTIISFEGGLADHNLNDLTFFTDKHNKYATREAIDVLNARYQLFPRDKDLSPKSTSRHAALKRWVKQRIYNRLPFWFGPLSYFLYRYFFQLGFLDGKPGLIYHFLQGFWYRFLVGAKVQQYDSALVQCANAEERLLTLERLTGHKLIART